MKKIVFLIGLQIYLSSIQAQDSQTVLENIRYVTSIESFIKLNRVSKRYPKLKPKTKEVIEKLHKSLFIVDLHADTMLFPRKFLKGSRRGHVDLPRMQKGNMGLQVFSTVTKSPIDVFFTPDYVRDQNDMITMLYRLQGLSKEKISSLYERAKFQAEKLHTIEKNSLGQFKIIKNQNDLNNYIKARKHTPLLTAGLLALEGLHPIGNDNKNLLKLFNMGYRMASLTHFFDNQFAGSAHGIEKDGLTADGIEAVKLMESYNMIIDLAHSSSKTIDQVLKMVTRPIVVSHVGVNGQCTNGFRNISDQQIKAIANNGGLIGVGFWEGAVCGTKASDTVLSMKYIIDLLGNADHISLGSDFDGLVKAHFDVGNIIMITEALVEAGIIEEDIKKIMGENVLRLFKNLLPK